MERTAESIRPARDSYEFGRVDQNIFTGIYECNEWCRCSRVRCWNRVVQRPLANPLQLFKTAEKGWGVRSLVDVPAGGFVCMYAGAMLTDELADLMGIQAGDEYFADLDLIGGWESCFLL